MEQLQSHIRLTASSYMEKYLRISTYIMKLFLIYDFETAPLWISLFRRKILFYFLSVCKSSKRQTEKQKRKPLRTYRDIWWKREWTVRTWWSWARRWTRSGGPQLLLLSTPSTAPTRTISSSPQVAGPLLLYMIQCRATRIFTSQSIVSFFQS